MLDRRSLLAIAVLLTIAPQWSVANRGNFVENSCKNSTISRIIKAIHKEKNLASQEKLTENMFNLLSKTDNVDISDSNISEIMLLLDIPFDPARYWIARSIGVLGAKGKVAIPKLKSVLAQVDCLRGSKTSASGIRFALAQLGEAVPPDPICSLSRH